MLALLPVLWALLVPTWALLLVTWDWQGLHQTKKNHRQLQLVLR
jgi:hypothetical protein